MRDHASRIEALLAEEVFGVFGAEAVVVGVFGIVLVPEDHADVALCPCLFLDQDACLLQKVCGDEDGQPARLEDAMNLAYEALHLAP